MSQPNSSFHPHGTQDEPQADSSSVTRRGFLGGLGGAAAAAAATGSLIGPVISGGSRAEAQPFVPSGGRLDDARQHRIDRAEAMFSRGLPTQTPNGDEDDFPGFVANYSKGLPHDSIGEVDPVAYAALLAAVASGDPADFELIPLGGARKLVNPQSGLAFDTHGSDPQQFALPAAPKFDSAQAAAEVVELYWMALLRDFAFLGYDSNSGAALAAAELSSLSDFRGPKIGGQVTPQTLFRDDMPGCLDGPYISQFMYLPTPFGAEYVERKMRTMVAGNEFNTTLSDWMAVNNGNVPGTQTTDPVRRFIRNGRDLSQWVHIDVLFQAYFNACLILGTPPNPSDRKGGGIGCPSNPGNPYHASANQEGFGTWGGPAMKTLMCEVAARALKAQWYQKWFVHRRLRPETFGGRIHQHKSGAATYPIHSEVLDSSAVDRMHTKYGTYLLPTVFPEGSPTHPAYGAGHAAVAGACVTVLKAIFDETFIIPDPVIPNPQGTRLVNFNGPDLTAGGELNKLASNVGTGRNLSGVHYRTEGVPSFTLGEAVAIEVLRDYATLHNEGGSYQFTKFDGTPITIEP